MIDLKDIQRVTKKIIQEKPLSEKQAFLVDADISSDRSINILLDAYQGISIDDCTNVSKSLRKHFEPEIYDYDLTVSSAGLTNPFKVKEQYIKSIGKEIKIQTKEGKRTRGKLLNVTDSQISIEVFSKKQKKSTEETIEFDNIKSAKAVISF